MNVLRLITTEGCAGCTIMERNINAALKETKKEVEFKAKDRKEVGKKFLSTFRITDFPTLLFFKDGNLKFKTSGTVPPIVILRWIEVHFR